MDLIGSFDRFAAKEYINAGCFFPQTSLPDMNLDALSNSVGNVLYEKGVIGHVTVDLVAFPDPTNPRAHPLFWAVDVNCQLSDYAAACFFFDFLMEGKLDKYTGQYSIEVGKDQDDMEGGNPPNDPDKREVETVEPRTFMYSKFMHHPGLSTIQYKTFFHMCRLEVRRYNLSFSPSLLIWRKELDQPLFCMIVSKVELLL